MKTLITNGNVITAGDNYFADVLIEGDKVAVIGAKLTMEADRTIDAAGKLVIPGGIDPHTHMELPFGGTFASDDFRTGTIAAASNRRPYSRAQPPPTSAASRIAAASGRARRSRVIQMTIGSSA